MFELWVLIGCAFLMGVVIGLVIVPITVPLFKTVKKKCEVIKIK